MGIENIKKLLNFTNHENRRLKIFLKTTGAMRPLGHREPLNWVQLDPNLPPIPVFSWTHHVVGPGILKKQCSALLRGWILMPHFTSYSFRINDSHNSQSGSIPCSCSAHTRPLFFLFPEPKALHINTNHILPKNRNPNTNLSSSQIQEKPQPSENGVSSVVNPNSPALDGADELKMPANRALDW